MSDWKLRHKIFHMLCQGMDLGDDLSRETIIIENEPEKIIERAIAYPATQTKELYYPGKSYAVAIIFAKLLEKNFGEDFYNVLDDDDLLYGNDPYFQPYHKQKKIYDKIIEQFPFQMFEDDEWRGSENAGKTIEYFYKEFLLHEDTKDFLPDN